MSSEAADAVARVPKRARGKQRVAELLEAAAAAFAEKGYEAATMTEIAARAGAPIGSLYQFFPVKEVLADALVQNYSAMVAADLQELEARAGGMDIKTLVEGLFGVLPGHPRERGALTLTDEPTRRATFRHMLRKHIAAILRAHAPAMPADAARGTAVVMLQLMKAANMLSDEEGLPGRAAGLRELQALAVHYMEQRLHPWAD
jgi:AcrR family transcriptional regulator